MSKGREFMRRRGAEAEFDLEERMTGHPMGSKGFPKSGFEAKYLAADVIGLKYGGTGKRR